jgi:twitching motility protein PilU
MAEKEGSDMYFTTGARPSIKINGKLTPLSKSKLDRNIVKKIAYELMSEDQIAEFEMNLEMNLAIAKDGIGRFRFNIFMQRGEVSIVVRFIKTNIPKFKDLNLPNILGDIILEKRGLILVVGATGSGKSTSMSSMLDYRNTNDAGHILTIEDPIEFIFEHRKSIINQREVGIDTRSYKDALREALREAPDVIMVGEIRDKETMEASIAFADTGHLCLSTLHATNASQALDRIINFFPPEQKNQILMDLGLNLNAIISQRLLNDKTGGRVAAVEVMINTPHISQLIISDRLDEIKDAMSKGGESNMVTFDQALFGLFKKGKVDLLTALENADSRSELEWKMHFGGGSVALTSATDKKKEALDFTKLSHLEKDDM